MVHRVLLKLQQKLCELIIIKSKLFPSIYFVLIIIDNLSPVFITSFVRNEELTIIEDRICQS